MPKEIRLNAFHMNAPGHSWAGLWRHPRDNSVNYKSLDYWVNLAQTAERGLLDGVFLADVFGIYDVYGGNADATRRAAAQSPINDPTLIVPTMAYHTKHVGFGVTSTLTYEHPFQFARRYSTLDHLTGGRAGWNIVTGYLASGARGMGRGDVRTHDDRYDVGEDFLEAAYKLWEGSWEDGAVVHDRAGHTFTRPEKVHAVRHDGPYFKVDGPHLSEPSPQRTPVLYQAGTSGRGRAFAARHSEAIFLNGQSRRIVADAVRDVRTQARSFGRDPYDILFFLGATVIAAPTRAEALDLAAEYARYVDPAGQLALVSGWSGIDFGKYDLDQPITYEKNNSIQSFVENITLKADKPITPRELIAFNQTGARGPFIVGSASEVADELIEWVEDTDVDGFNLVRVVVPETLSNFVDLVVPELQARGRFKTAYREGTLREKLFPGRGPLLHPTHPGAAFRNLARTPHLQEA
ncbi:LLM class flavin-dependent oxidoreductase [Zavarzinia sp. CC-PAN008]|uniref:LLM class flavin-dependent oxidoreductase n=1 Tax=Zavarzinia sp. CC-PAN008 TaxID=3243332 RepID=UPI003F7455D9